jgi:DNA-binding XRE family transcriptional regulator
MGHKVANIEITGGLLKAIKKRTARTQVEMGRALEISEKWYGLIESGEKEISSKVKERVRSRFKKEITDILANEKVNVYLADPSLLEEFLEFSRRTKLQKEIKRKESTDALLKIESLVLGIQEPQSDEKIAALRTHLNPEDLERAKIYLAAFDSGFTSTAISPEKVKSAEAAKWFLKTMNQVFSESEPENISEEDLSRHRRNLLVEDEQKLIEVACRVDDSNHISENQDESMVTAWKLLIGINKGG